MVLADFYNEHKRGWYWFEEENPAGSKKKQLLHPIITPEVAKQTIENFKAELENAKNIMMVAPTVDNVHKYLKLEEQMWEQASKLENAYALAKFLYPQADDLANVPAVRVRREIEASHAQELIKGFSKEFDLVLVKSSSCPYCKQFEPILADFATQYGFNCDALSIDGSKSAYFKTMQNAALVKKMNIESLPALLLVHKSKPLSLQLSIGLLTFTELEQRFALVEKYLKYKAQNENTN